MITPISKSYNDFLKLKEFLREQGEVDFSINLENDFTKNLLISSASFIEDSLQKVLIQFVESNSNKDIIIHFLKNKAISRQYHSYFDWKSKNINNFLGLFGVDFKKKFNQDIKIIENMELNVESFLELGRLRNELVHQNFILYKLEKTSQEIFSLFEESSKFITFFEEKINYLSKR